jgi:para-nitrobenzyl esterase
VLVVVNLSAGEVALQQPMPSRGARSPAGGFTSGGGGGPAFDGSNLATLGDVVVVTVNHRLNIFGFLNLGYLDDEFADSANAGQLDIIAALRWVQNNISVFGGDPGNVTPFGQSGGGSKVVTLMAMRL